jgi:hypothetical protein
MCLGQLGTSARVLVSLKMRCKPHPGPREGLNPLAPQIALKLLNLYAAGFAGHRQFMHGGN